MRSIPYVAGLSLALLACSSGEGGTAGSSRTGPLDLGSSSAADPGSATDFGTGLDPGSGTERGDTPTFGPCQRTSDCSRGVCSKEPTSLSKNPGFCVTICAPPPFQSSPFPIAPCAKTEQCVRSGSTGLGFCLRPCKSRTDCSVFTGCSSLRGTTGTFCQPFDDEG